MHLISTQLSAQGLLWDALALYSLIVWYMYVQIAQKLVKQTIFFVHHTVVRHFLSIHTVTNDDKAVYLIWY